MYTAIKPIHFLSGMKKDVENFVAKCLEFQRVKVDHFHPTRVLYPHEVQQHK